MTQASCLGCHFEMSDMNKAWFRSFIHTHTILRILAVLMSLTSRFKTLNSLCSVTLKQRCKVKVNTLDHTDVKLSCFIHCHVLSLLCDSSNVRTLLSLLILHWGCINTIFNSIYTLLCKGSRHMHRNKYIQIFFKCNFLEK